MKIMGTETATFRSGLRDRVSRARRIAGAAVAFVILLLSMLVNLGSAMADEYEPVSGTMATRTATDPNPFVVAAYGFIWVALVIYVVGIARGVGRANAEIADLRRRVNAAGGGPNR